MHEVENRPAEMGMDRKQKSGLAVILRWAIELFSNLQGLPQLWARLNS